MDKLMCGQEKKHITLSVIAVVALAFLILGFNIVTGEFFKKQLGAATIDRSRNIWSDMIVEQELFVDNTLYIDIDLEAHYVNGTKSRDGLNVQIQCNDEITNHFIKLSELKVNEHQKVRIYTPELLGKCGKVTMRLESMGMDEDNYMVLFMSKVDQPQSLTIMGKRQEGAELVINYSYISLIRIIVFLTMVLTILALNVSFFSKRKCISSARTICIGVVIAFVISGGIMSIVRWRLVSRSGEEYTVSINNSTTLSENVKLSNTKDICVFIRPNTQDTTEAKINAKIEQGEKVREYSYDVKNLIVEYYGGWNYLNIDTSDFRNGYVNLTLSGDGFKRKEIVDVVIISGKQVMEIGPVCINGEMKAGQYMNMRVQYFDYKLFITVFVGIFLFFIALIEALTFANEKYKYEPITIVAIAVVCISMIKGRVFTGPLNGWCVTPYLYSYAYGPLSRALPGEIIKRILLLKNGSDFISSSTLRQLFITNLVIFSALIIAFIDKFLKDIKKYNEKLYSSAQILTTLFIASPLYVSFYCTSGSLGRLDVLLGISFIISSFCIYKNKCLYLVPFITGMATLTHQLFVFTELPVLLIILLYEWLVSRKKEYRIIAVTTLCTNFIAAVFCQYVAKSNVDYSFMINSMQARTDFPILELAVAGEHYFSSEYFLNWGIYDFVNLGIIFQFIILVIVLMPIIIYISSIYSHIIKACSNKMEKILILGLWVSPVCILVTLPAMAYDFGRWMVETGIAFFIGTMLLMIKSSGNVSFAIESINDQWKRKYGYIIFILLIIYLMSSGTITTLGTDFSANIYNFIKDIVVNLRY